MRRIHEDGIIEGLNGSITAESISICGILPSEMIKGYRCISLVKKKRQLSQS